MMYKGSKKTVAFILVLSIILSLAVCASGTSGMVTVDENGVASWDVVQNAVGYEYNIVDADHTAMELLYTPEASIQLPEGYCVHVRAVFADGTTGDWMVSEYYGEPVRFSTGEEAPANVGVIAVDENGLASWDAVPGAVEYEYLIVDATYTAIDVLRTPETSVQIPQGYSVHVCPVMANGETGDWMTSDYYGEPAVYQDMVEEMPPADADMGPVDENGLAGWDASEIALDENGLASWDAVADATGYEYCFIDSNGDSPGPMNTTETSVQLPEGFSVHVRAVLADGSYGYWMSSDYFGEPVAYQATVEENISNILTVDENGLASWDAVPGAVKYLCELSNPFGIIEDTWHTTETTLQIPENYFIFVTPIFEDGTRGEAMAPLFSEEYAHVDVTLYVDAQFDVKWEDLNTFDVISAINLDSIKTLDDGSVYFEATAPNGGVMRFVGTDVTVAEGALTFGPKGKISALDALGRICAVAPVTTDPGSASNSVRFSGGYTFTDATSVDSEDELFFIWGFGSETSYFLAENGPKPVSHMRFQPNFIALGAETTNVDAFTISQLIVYYDEATYTTGIRMLALNTDMYGSYLEGEYYEPAKEVYSSADEIYDFYLMAIPDVADEWATFQPDPLVDDIMDRSLIDFDDSRFTVGELKAGDGSVLDKSNAKLTVGSTVEVTIGDYTLDVQLPVLAKYTGVQTLHELTPYNNAYAQGEVTSLVVPVFWQDQPEYATDEALDELCRKLGRVTDAQGNVTDYSEGLTDGFSLSGYYDIVSYGQHRITSFVTDWYAAPYNFAGDMEDRQVADGLLAKEIYDWVFATYPDMDWSQFDRNADGFLDSVILINVGKDSGDGIMQLSYSHAIHVSPGYTGEGAGTQNRPALKNYVSLNTFYLEGSTLIHEYAHGFGLVDYYDVTYSGIDAVGSYDMQSASLGDWNAYSKYAVGWIQPEIVQGLASGESVEITIGSLAATGDAIVIPAAGTEHDGPFGEYMLIDLFTDDGVNEYDAAKFGLDDTVGVRIYHVSSPMEKRVLTGTDGVDYPIGTIHYANAYNEEGKYLLELLQAGGDNTFTDAKNLRTNLMAKDLFAAGDVFTAEAYAEYLTDGRMDDGSEFGYTVEIVAIEADENGEPAATIRVTRK